MKKSRGLIILIGMLLCLAGLTYVAAAGIGEEKAGAASNIKLGLDLAGGVSITYQVVGDETPSAEDLSDTVYKLQKRVESYSTEALVYPEGDDRINIEIPGVSDANAILQELGQPGSLYFIMQYDTDGNANYDYNYSTGIGTLNYPIEDLIANGSVVLVGTDVESSEAGYQTDNMNNKEAVVALELTTEGTTKFAEATTLAAASGETIAIYYDGTFVSVPSVSNAITGGQAQITGMDSFEEAEKLASTIRIGGLKLELEELRSNVVGAQLGEAAISTSLKAGAIGFAVVAVMMIAIYWIPGLASAIALCIYVSLVLVLLNAFNITLTLPGIAGIILSIGMAVDANVIIFARIREELGSGKTVQSSIKIGFEKALSAIIDGNVTTLIAAFVLGIKGTGSVKGFAQTLALGIIVSLFTALFITRFILNAFYALGIKDVKFYGVIKEKKSFDFIGKRKFFFAGAVIAIVAGFVAMGINSANGNGAMNYSLDFIGGTSTNVTLNEDLTIEEINEQVVPVFETITGDANIQPQKISGGNSIIVKTRALNVDEREALNTALVESFGVDEQLITSETIGSTISSEMQMDAIVAVLISLVLMLIYIWFRFKDLRFATSSIMSLLHDVLVVLTCYAVLRIPVGSNFIACELTIIGYSINATIVIFDRVRENMVGLKKNADLKEVLNKSITQTLSRSIFTSLTTFITIGALYVLGVSSIREFALPLMVGVVAGTYSSVCLSGAFWYVAKTKFVKKTK